MLAYSRRLLAALFLAYAFSLYGALGGLPGEPEHEVHLFLASHYAQDYFALNDPRGENGFSVAGHPPLSHQLVALLSRVPGLNIERAYALMTVAAAVLLVIAVWLFAATAGDWATAPNAALALSLYPCLYLFLFPFGQLPFILSAALAFGAAAAIGFAVQSGSGLACALAGSLTVASLTAHPVGLVPIALGLCLSTFVANAPAVRNFFGLFVSLAATAQIAFLALLPFLSSIWKERARAIPLSKFHLGQNRAADAGALLILLTALLGILFAKYRRERALGAAAVLFLLLSLGDFATGIASDKLFYLSGAFALIASASSFARMGYRSRLVLPVVGAVSLAIANAYILGEPGSQARRKHRAALMELVALLGQPGNERWRYVTLGLGSERFALARNLRLGSLDAGIPWLLPAKELRATRFYSIDELPLENDSAQKVLREILSHADEHALRWVISADDRASALLEGYGYSLRSAWKGGLVLWSRSSVPQGSPVARIQTPSAILWGVIPPLSLLMSLTLVFAALKDAWPDRRRRAPPALRRSRSMRAVGAPTSKTTG